MSARVRTAQGELEGVDNRYHQAFLGIPFARPPIAQHRFKPPAPPAPWSGLRSATAFAPSCPQGYHPIPGMAASGARDEDCLYLNIYTPAADGDRRPVLFWIHGGGFQMGSGSEQLYNGGHLAERGDVVVVTIHYRLGALGYAYFGEQATDAGWCPNLGQLDQIEALKWVGENITAFGGDPGNVTIFGESAGASAIAVLLAMPAAKGWFSKAIMQSGSGAGTSNLDRAGDLGQALLRELGISSDQFDDLLARPVDEIIAAQTMVNSGSAGLGSFCPVRDGDLLPDFPHDAVREGSAPSIPVIVGTNRDESKLFNATPNRPAIGEEDLLDRLEGILGTDEQTVRSVISLFRESRREQGLPDANHDILDVVQSIVAFRVPGNRLAEYQSRHQSQTYQYLFNWESPARHGELGACHALEMPFVFGTLDAPTQDRFAGKGPEVEDLARNMMDAWVAFAKTGSPSHPRIGAWKPYEHRKRSTMVFDRTCSLQDDPLRSEREMIERLI